MPVDMEEFHAAFFEEAAEHLATLETELLALESAPGDVELLNNIFRAAHSIKGASGMLGFTEISGFTHLLENLLDRMRDGAIPSTPGRIDLLLRATDTLAGLVTMADGTGQAPAQKEAVTQELKAVLDQSGDATEEHVPADAAEDARIAAEYRISFSPSEDLLRQGMDPALILSELSQLGEVLDVRADATNVPPLFEMDPESCYLAWSLRVRTDRTREEIEDVFVFVEDGSSINLEQIKAGSSAPPKGEQAKAPQEAKSSGVRPACGKANESIRVSVDKVEELINLVGELVIANSMVHEAMGNLQTDSVPLLQEAMAVMDRSTRELQDQVMAVRMLPIGSVFRRFPRLVRDLAGNLEKQITVHISGEETELDKQVIEEIGDPLTHLVRNSVDHGIEPPEERTEAGKPKEGTVHLKAYHEGGNVIIDISDDGRGLNAQRIREKAIAQGLIAPSDELSEDEVNMLIFAAGFSTAQTVSDVSGRGVGLDVVRRNVEALKGSVHILTRAGQGTTFRIKLPLTMAILDGLSVAMGSEVYVLPLLSVLESFRPKREEVKHFAGTGEVVVVRGEAVPLLRLHDLLNAPANITDPCEGLVVIVEHQNRKFGLLVDELLGQLQVVMKSLEANYRCVEGVSGATILGDGRVAFILDIAGLIRMAR